MGRVQMFKRLAAMQKARATGALRRWLASMAVVLMSPVAMAGTDLGDGGGATFAQLRAWMQDFVDFIDGPFGLAAVVISIVVAFTVWVFAPKEGIMGPVLRVVIAGVAILNVAVMLASLRAA